MISTKLRKLAKDIVRITPTIGDPPPPRVVERGGDEGDLFMWHTKSATPTRLWLWVDTFGGVPPTGREEIGDIVHFGTYIRKVWLRVRSKTIHLEFGDNLREHSEHALAGDIRRAVHEATYFRMEGKIDQDDDIGLKWEPVPENSKQQFFFILFGPKYTGEDGVWVIIPSLSRPRVPKDVSVRKMELRHLAYWINHNPEVKVVSFPGDYWGASDISLASSYSGFFADEDFGHPKGLVEKVETYNPKYHKRVKDRIRWHEEGKHYPNATRQKLLDQDFSLEGLSFAVHTPKNKTDRWDPWYTQIASIPESEVRNIKDWVTSTILFVKNPEKGYPAVTSLDRKYAVFVK